MIAALAVYMDSRLDGLSHEDALRRASASVGIRKTTLAKIIRAYRDRIEAALSRVRGE